MADAVNESKTISNKWIDEYQPKSYIEDNIYNNLLNSIETDELLEVISNLPNGKACGPSGISNEMIKHCDDQMIQLIKILLTICLQLNDIPKEWKLATVFPIPKPKEWGCKLNNTRPITLLETFRKLFTKILNNRLAQIMVTNKVLKGHNFAGLPHGSTFEPIRIIDNMINDARHH